MEFDEEIPIRRVGVEYANDAVSILKEAAAWALSRGIVVWRTDGLRERDFREAALLGDSQSSDVAEWFPTTQAVFPGPLEGEQCSRQICPI
jgi:hypothetical protein